MATDPKAKGGNVAPSATPSAATSPSDAYGKHALAGADAKAGAGKVDAKAAGTAGATTATTTKNTTPVKPEDSQSPTDTTATAQQVVASAPKFRPGIEPRNSPAARRWLFLIGLILLVLGGITVREVLVLTNNAPGPQWFTQPINWLGDAKFEQWFIVPSIIAIIVGLIIFIGSLLPRGKSHVSIDEEASIWVRPVDIARLCSSRVEKVHGVLRAHTVATRKKITVTARGKVSDPTVEGHIRDAVEPVVEFLGGHHDLKVRVVAGRDEK